MTTDFSPAALATAAGADPWVLARQVTDGRPEEVRGVGLAFRAARARSVEVARLAGVADRTTAAAFTNNRVGVWDAEAAGRRTSGLLSGNGDDMEDVARALIIVGDELAASSAAVGRELALLTEQVNGVIARRNAFLAETARLLPPDDRAAAERGFLAEAAELVRACARRIQGHLDAYDRTLASRTGFLADLGYEQAPAPTGRPVGGLDTTSILPPGGNGPEILGTPPGARLEGGFDPGLNINVPAPGGGLVLGTPIAPDLGLGQTDRGGYPLPFPVGSRVFATDGEPTPDGEPSPDGPPPIDAGKQGKHIPEDPNYIPGRSILTGDPDDLITEAGSGDQVGSAPVGTPGSKERIDFGKEIGMYVDVDGNATPTTVGIVHYGKTGAHIVPARPR